MENYIETLQVEFQKNANANIAIQQKAYMRDQFEYYGMKTDKRREIQKPFLVKEFLPEKNKAHTIIKALWDMPERDYHYFSQELAFKYVRKMERKDIALFEFMVTHKSWWDTVDFIAVKLMGAYFKAFPEERSTYVQKWIKSNNIWLQRSALLFQLKYKQEIDPILLNSTINSLLGSKEFFINKAIGWVLREYSRTDPKWVTNFSNKTELSNLSKKEALRLLS